jgi:hypothetical protein
MGRKTIHRCVAAFLLALALAGCGDPFTRPARPVLLMEVSPASDDPTIAVQNVRIVRDDGTEITISTGVLEAQQDDGGWYRGGYAFYLTEGQTYTEIRYQRGTDPLNAFTKSISIVTARAGMVYFVVFG